MLKKMKRFTKSGVTLIEVIFSIGIVLIGLLGLLSILPLAGGRAREAEDLTVAAQLGDSVLKELSVRKLLSNRLLIDIERDVEGNSDLIDVNSNLGTISVTKKTSISPEVFATTVQHGLCIDPLYQEFTQINNPTTNAQFTDLFFPYVNLNHHPMANPSDASAPDWPTNRPRMLRVGLAGASPDISRVIVENRDDLIAFRPKDRSEPTRLPGLQSNTTLGYGRRVPTGEHSWIATIDPLPGGRFASLSVVVIRNRDSQRDFPETGQKDKPRENGVNERMGYISGAVGFSGGSGGIVSLVGSQSVLDRIVPNDWIMLSRFNYKNSDALFRWYRVVSVENESQLFTTDGDPDNLDSNLGCYLPSTTGSQSIWVRKLVLDGPDWNFGFANDPPTTAPPPPPPPTEAQRFGNNTFATIVSDVISVTERIVKLEDL